MKIVVTWPQLQWAHYFRMRLLWNACHYWYYWISASCSISHHEFEEEQKFKFTKLENEKMRNVLYLFHQAGIAWVVGICLLKPFHFWFLKIGKIIILCIVTSTLISREPGWFKSAHASLLQRSLISDFGNIGILSVGKCVKI